MSRANTKSFRNSEEGIHCRPSSQVYGCLGARQISMPPYNKACRQNDAEDAGRLVLQSKSYCLWRTSLDGPMSRLSLDGISHFSSVGSASPREVTERWCFE